MRGNCGLISRRRWRWHRTLGLCAGRCDCVSRGQLQTLTGMNGVRRSDAVPLRQIAKVHLVAKRDRIQRVTLHYLVAATGNRGMRSRRHDRAACVTASRFHYH